MDNFVPPQAMRTDYDAQVHSADYDELTDKLMIEQQLLEAEMRELQSIYLDVLDQNIINIESTKYPQTYAEAKKLYCDMLGYEVKSADTQEMIKVLTITLQSLDIYGKLNDANLIEDRIQGIKYDMNNATSVADVNMTDSPPPPPPPPPPPSSPKRKLPDEKLSYAKNQRPRKKRQKLILKKKTYNKVSKKNKSRGHDIGTTNHTITRAQPTKYETTLNLRPDIFAALDKNDEIFGHTLFSKKQKNLMSSQSNINLTSINVDNTNNKIPADDNDNSNEIQSDSEDEAILDRDIWKQIRQQSQINSKGDKWKTNEVDKLCAGVWDALKKPKTYGKPGGKMWWQQVTKKVNDRPWSGNKKKLKDTAKDKKAYRHSEMAKFKNIIEHRRSQSAVTQNLQEMARYTNVIRKRQIKTEHTKHEKEKEEKEFREKRSVCLDLIHKKLKEAESGPKKKDETVEPEPEPKKKYDSVIKEIKNKCDDLEDMNRSQFFEEDLDAIRDVTFGDHRDDIKCEYLRLKEKYNGDVIIVFGKLIKEAKRLLK